MKKQHVHFELDIDLYKALKEQAQSLDKTLSAYVRAALTRATDDQRLRTEQLKQIKALQEQTKVESAKYFRTELDEILETAKEHE